MADIIPLRPNMQPDVPKEELQSASQELKDLLMLDEKNSDLVDDLVNLLALPDEEFDVLAPGVMDSFEKSFNNPEDKLALVQNLNANGLKAEDLTASFAEVVDSIEESPLPRNKRDFLTNLMAVIVNAINDTEGIAKRLIQIPIEKCHKNAVIPEYAHISDSGMDVYALEDIAIGPGETVLVPTGLKVALPAGFELQVRPKSGRALKTKLRVANTPGTIDQGYRDEIKVIIENIDPPIRKIHIDGKEPNDSITIGDIEFGQSYTIGKGEKFCQLVLCEVPKASFYEVESVLDVDGENRHGGFGSTGLLKKENVENTDK